MSPSPAHAVGSATPPRTVHSRGFLEVSHRVCEPPTSELRIPIKLIQGDRYDKLLGSIERQRQGRHHERYRLRCRRTPSLLQHLVLQPAQQQHIGLGEVVDSVPVPLLI